MKLDRLTPMLWTNNIKASIEFYQTILGFELDEYNEEWKWCHMHKNKVNLMFVHRDEPTEDYDGVIKFTGSFYFILKRLMNYGTPLKQIQRFVMSLAISLILCGSLVFMTITVTYCNLEGN